MAVMLILILVIIVGYVFAVIYKHDDSDFSKHTGYSLIDVLTNKKAHIAKRLYEMLPPDKETYKVLLNLQINDGQQKRSIDSVLIHSSGIYIINAQHKTGWIAGREFDTEWINLLHKDAQQMFENPVNENKRAIFALRALFPEVDSDVFSSLIIFSDSCSFQKIELHSENVEVIKSTELKKWSASLVGELLSKSQVDEIYSALKPYEKKLKIQQPREQAKAAV